MWIYTRTPWAWFSLLGNIQYVSTNGKTFQIILWPFYFGKRSKINHNLFGQAIFRTLAFILVFIHLGGFKSHRIRELCLFLMESSKSDTMKVQCLDNTINKHWQVWIIPAYWRKSIRLSLVKKVVVFTMFKISNSSGIGY